MSEFKTEAEALERLRGYVHVSEVLVQGVRSAPGFDCERIADAISIGSWVSRGHSTNLYEIKCSRSDWLAELENPEKMDAFFPYMNYVWLVAPSKKIIRVNELPTGWGLLTCSGTGLRRVVRAERYDAKPLSVGLVVTMLRAERRRAEDVQRSSPSVLALQTEFDKGYAVGEKNKTAEREIIHLRSKLQNLKNVIAAFEKQSGLKIADAYTAEETAANLGRQVAAIQAGGIETLQSRLPVIQQALDVMQRGVDKIKSLGD